MGHRRRRGRSATWTGASLESGVLGVLEGAGRQLYTRDKASGKGHTADKSFPCGACFPLKN